MYSILVSSLLRNTKNTVIQTETLCLKRYICIVEYSLEGVSHHIQATASYISRLPTLTCLPATFSSNNFTLKQQNKQPF